MANKAFVTRRSEVQPNRARASERAAVENLNLVVEQELDHASLVRGDPAALPVLEKQGFRVKLLPDTHILQVGGYRIDIERANRVPAALGVPKALEKSWTHHLVQLAAPPQEVWIAAIEALGIDVVEPVSSYGLFVAASPELIKQLDTLPFVAWYGPFKPAYRLAPNLVDKIKHLSPASLAVGGSLAAADWYQALDSIHSHVRHFKQQT